MNELLSLTQLWHYYVKITFSWYYVLDTNITGKMSCKIVPLLSRRLELGIRNGYISKSFVRALIKTCKHIQNKEKIIICIWEKGSGK